MRHNVLIAHGLRGGLPDDKCQYFGRQETVAHIISIGPCTLRPQGSILVIGAEVWIPEAFEAFVIPSGKMKQGRQARNGVLSSFQETSFYALNVMVVARDPSDFLYH